MASLLNMSSSRLVGSKSLPYDAEIEYLKSSGTQWIEIPMPKGEIISFEIEFKLPTQTFACGSWKTGAANYPAFSIDGYNRLFVTNIQTLVRITLNYGFVANNDISLVYRNGILTTNGVQKYAGLSIGADYIGTFILYGLNRNDSIRLLTNGAEFRRFKVETVNGLIDLVPVRVGTTGYMYDKVSKQLFGNSGTGAFILGADKTN